MTYPWRRFWCPLDRPFSLGDDGYLADPEDSSGLPANQHLLRETDLATIPCLVALGEPGMGKTHAHEAALADARTRANDNGNVVFAVDLRSIGSDQRLFAKVFENPEFRRWAAGSHQLTLFLDSFDECLLQVTTVASILADEFPNYPVDRLFLRIFCRTAVWPALLDESLKKLWSSERTVVAELMPLRRMDVAQAASANGIEAEAFLSAVDAAGVVPLAVKPITLDPLITLFRREGALPQTQWELYERGCHLLCEETSLSRRAAGLTGSSSADDRLTVAGRIAAVTLFSNHNAVFTEPYREDLPDGSLALRALAGETESASTGEINVSEAGIREALGTALFTSRGAGLLGWAHQTYAEFLAARYVTQRPLTVDQVTSLIAHPDDPEQRIVPQLQQVAAWIALRHPEVFAWILKTDPAVLLQSDLASVSIDNRKQLVDQLLAYIEREHVSVWQLPAKALLRKLAHPDLTEQLHPYLADTTLRFPTRLAVIYLAVECEQTGLVSDLLRLSLDPSEAPDLRGQAARAIGRLGDAEACSRLLPLAAGRVGSDPNDEAKGNALSALWPDVIAASELFPLLSIPKNTSLLGSYSRFVHRLLMPHLQPDDLPAALAWVTAEASSTSAQHPFHQTMSQILSLGWNHLGRPDVVEPMCRAVLACLRTSDRPLIPSTEDASRERLYEEPVKRRRLLEGIVKLLAVGEGTPSLLVLHPQIAFADDLPWLIERLEEVDDPALRTMYAQIARRVFPTDDDVRFGLIYNASQRSPELTEAFREILNPVILGSDEAARMREHDERIQQWQRERAGPPPLDPPPAQRIQQDLDAIEAGEIEAWGRLSRAMHLLPDGSARGSELGLDLTALPGWETVDETTQARMLAAAAKYIERYAPEPEPWLDNNIHWPDAGGVRAFRLLFDLDLGRLEKLPSTVWSKWSPAILVYESYAETSDTSSRRLLALAYLVAPKEFVDALLHIIDEEDRQHGDVFELRRLDLCWDRQLAEAILAKASSISLSPRSFRTLVGALLAHPEGELAATAAKARQLAFSALRMNDEDRTLMAAAVLMEGTADAGWSELWPFIESHPDVGRRLIELTVRECPLNHRWTSRLNEEALADFYLWLVGQYPHSEDPRIEGAHTLSVHQFVEALRDSLPICLRDRGTPAACAALTRIAQALPDEHRIRTLLHEAEWLRRQQTWVPPSPKTVLQLARDAAARYVRNGEDLLNVLIESLDRLQKKLHGETPRVQFLWDTFRAEPLSPKQYRPKDEEALSDFLKSHFGDDLGNRGIIVNREVEISRNFGGASGEETDIWVQAFGGRDKKDVVTVIVEVKCCWHPKLKTAMQDQLVERYLNHGCCQHGLYVVGWYNCSQWDDADARKSQALKLKLTVEEAREHFTAQAASLSDHALHVRAFVLDTSLP